MDPRKTNIVGIYEVIDLKNFTINTIEQVKEQVILKQQQLLYRILCNLLEKEPNETDFANIEVNDSIKNDVEEVFYCDVKIGELQIECFGINIRDVLINQKPLTYKFTPLDKL